MTTGPSTTSAVEAMIAAYEANSTEAHFHTLLGADISDGEILEVAYRVAARNGFAPLQLFQLCRVLITTCHFAEAAWFLKQLERGGPTLDAYRFAAHVAGSRGDLRELARIHERLKEMAAPEEVLVMVVELAHLVRGDAAKLAELVAEVTPEHLRKERLLPIVHLQAALRVGNASAAADAVVALLVHGFQLGLGKRQQDQLMRLLRARLVQLVVARGHP